MSNAECAIHSGSVRQRAPDEPHGVNVRHCHSMRVRNGHLSERNLLRNSRNRDCVRRGLRIGALGPDENSSTQVRRLLLVAMMFAGAILSAQSDHLNPTIGSVDPARYAKIQVPQWKNPILVIQSEGVELRATGVSQRYVSTAALKRVLISLPVGAWPYGRVVAQTDQHILPVPWNEYLRKMAETRAAGAQLLRDLDVKADVWFQ